MSRAKVSERQKFEASAERKVKAFQAFHPVLSEFVTKSNGKRRGVVVSFLENEKIYVGCSLCNLRRDKWNNYVGLNYAIERASSDYADLPKVPQSCRAGVEKMIERARRYFKDAA
jgi:hypothetical protein